MKPHRIEDWYRDPIVVMEIARFAEETSAILTISDMLDFIETPWSYPELYDEYLEDAGVTTVTEMIARPVTCPTCITQQSVEIRGGADCLRKVVATDDNHWRLPSELTTLCGISVGRTLEPGVESVL